MLSIIMDCNLAGTNDSLLQIFFSRAVTMSSRQLRKLHLPESRGILRYSAYKSPDDLHKYTNHMVFAVQ
jgi:hypothetical protein